MLYGGGCDENQWQVCHLRPRQRTIQDADLHQAWPLRQVKIVGFYWPQPVKVSSPLAAGISGSLQNGGFSDLFFVMFFPLGAGGVMDI